MEEGIIMTTGAPAMPKELIGMEYWTSLFVQVQLISSFLALVLFSPISSLNV